MALEVVGDLLVDLFASVVETSVGVLVASVRPWRYVLSPSFRARVNLEYAGRHPWLKLWSLIWGAAALLGSIAIIAAVVMFIVWLVKPAPPPKPSDHLVHKAVEEVIRKYQELHPREH